MLDFSKFTEGHLTGLKVYQVEKRANLFLQEATGENWFLSVTEVVEFMTLQMRMQNIIDRICMWDAASDELEYQDKIFTLIHGKYVGENDDISSQVIIQTIDIIRRGEGVLIELLPVYGAHILIFAKSVSLEVAP